MNPRFKYLIQLLRKLPGVGPRQAGRFLLALLDMTDAELQEIGTAIVTLHKTVRLCKRCFNVADTDVCSICASTKRNQSQIMVVEKVTDLESVEKSGLYKGLYHVLGGVISPVDKITVESLRFQELQDRVENNPPDQTLELIIATNPTTAGETTALYLRSLFQNTKNVTITRLARGLASGSHIEYIDEITLKNALDYRK